jgi:hypothetical protein
MNVTDQIADLILQDPSISVKDLTRRMGYAEEKTIYYWLNKRGYRGIKAFKRAVLTGQYRASGAAREPGPRYGRLPVADRLAKTGEPLLTGETLPVTLDRGRGNFVFRYGGPPESGILPGDLLIIGPPDSERAEWVLVLTPAYQPALRRVVRTEHGPLLLDTITGEVDRQARVIGTVLQLARLFRPASP